MEGDGAGNFFGGFSVLAGMQIPHPEEATPGPLTDVSSVIHYPQNPGVSMGRQSGEQQDLLGLFALGSAVANLAQAEGNNRLKSQLAQLQQVLAQLRGRYALVCREYERMKALNDQLQQEVVTLRMENNKLLAAQVAKG